MASSIQNTSGNSPSFSSGQDSQSGIREKVARATSALSDQSFLIDWTPETSFGNKSETKQMKAFLPIFLSEQDPEKSIILKVSNKFPAIIKYALENGFIFQEANSQRSTLKFMNGHAVQAVPYTPKQQTTLDIKIESKEKDPKIPRPPNLDTTFLSEGNLQKEQAALRAQAVALNTQVPEAEIFANKNWDVNYYNRENYPVILGELDHKSEFSTRLNNLGLRFLDMPIHMPNQGWRIPPQLEQFQEVIAKAVAFERLANPDFEKQNYVYITVDQGEVNPGQAQRRTGWHGDSYLKMDSRKSPLKVPCDRVYVVADACSTPFLPGPFALDTVDPEDIDAVLAHFAKTAENKIPTYYPNYHLLKLDPYCVHNVGFNHSDQPVFRTFVKISVSQTKYCKLGNAHNHLFTYDWPMIPRYKVPYSNEALKESAHRKDRDQFLEVNPSLVDFSQELCTIPWAQSPIQTVQRTKEVSAEKAREGELLYSNSDGFLVTVYAANPGDWKVTASHQEQYFLSEEKLRKFYVESPHQKGVFIPKPIPRRAVQLTENIRFVSPWGTIQYAKKDDWLLFVDQGDIYTVTKARFEDEFSPQNT